MHRRARVLLPAAFGLLMLTAGEAAARQQTGADPAGPEGSAGPEPASTEEPAPGGYVRRHMWHWVVALGVDTLSNEYESRVGTSTDPLLFADPPGVDRWARQQLRQDTFHKNYVLDNRQLIALGLGAGTIVLANLRGPHAGRWMLDDATGLVELWYFDKGATQFAKSIVGRQRPTLEFIDDDTTLTPQERADRLANDNERQSFWSGAASRQFALMSYCDRIVAHRARSRAARVASFVGFYGFAAYVGWSRLAEDEHYLTDVVAGAAAGIFEARGFYRAHHPQASGAKRPGRAGRPGQPDADDGGRAIRFGGFAAVPGGVAVMFTVRP